MPLVFFLKYSTKAYPKKSALRIRKGVPAGPTNTTNLECLR